MKRKVVIGTVATMLILTTACSSGGKSGASEKPSAAPEEKFDKAATLVFYSIARDSEETFNDRLGNAIRKKFPNLTIKYIQRTTDNDLPAYLASGEKMDLVWGSLGSWPAVMDLSLGQDMTDLIKKHNVDLSVFEPSSIDAMKQYGGGKIYALPFENSTKVIYYNKDIFDKFGVPYPKDGMSWTEFTDLAKKLNRQEGGSAYTGYAPSVNSMFIQNELSVPFFDATTKRSTFNDPKWKKILDTEFMPFGRETGFQQVMTQYRKGGIPNLDTYTKDKVLAMYPEGPLLPIVLPNEMSQLNWDIVAMPTYPDNRGVGYQAYPSYMSVSSLSQEKDMAMQVIKFLTAKEFQTNLSKTGDMTILKDPDIQKVMGQDSKFKGKNYTAYFYNKFAPISPKLPLDTKIAAYNEVTGKLPQLAKGELDTNTALSQAAEVVDKKIDTLGSK